MVILLWNWAPLLFVLQIPWFSVKKWELSISSFTKTPEIFPSKDCQRYFWDYLGDSGTLAKRVKDSENRKLLHRFYFVYCPGRSEFNPFESFPKNYSPFSCILRSICLSSLPLASSASLNIRRKTSLDSSSSKYSSTAKQHHRNIVIQGISITAVNIA